MALLGPMSVVVLTVVLASAVIGTVCVLVTLRQAFATLSIQGVPGQKVQWIDPFFSLSIVLGPYFPRSGSVGSFYGKFTLYDRIGSTIVSAVRPFSGRLYYWIADADALKTVFGDRHTFTKDVAAYEVLNIYGKNLVSTEGAEWKRHKSIASPAFSESNNSLVWTETIRTLDQWFSELDVTFKDNATSTASIDIVARMTQVCIYVLAQPPR
ncbi:hypothetical protein OF83DRAFT_1091052 [Amylostereum chailletii]|nr:hypothetical protein OF83DRAFT_1091052 [Amylostereum chailletii]